METLIAIAAGIGLAAACGFRVFLPLLATSLAARGGYLNPSGGFDWIGSQIALVVFGAAALAEVVAYFIPWVDHALDLIASPAAAAAGTVAAAAAFGEIHPAIKWSAALIAGGGAASVVQAGTVAARALSGGTTAGVGNPVVALGELAGSLVLSVLSILLPIAGLLLAVVVLVLVLWTGRRLLRRRRLPAQSADLPSP
ncbi:MAG TPA: DUF4126 domain-containing protein [Tepidisphaeraceae bacterium]|nr:DUF4126 domain-containing protein [Tepidisphaeraceae bacterium]